ncbi:hypothetical protein SLE2022_308130 [Rubroshorea leprosula]
MSVGGAIAFVLTYVIYGFSVAANEIFRKIVQRFKLDAVTLSLSVRGSIFSKGGEENINLRSVPLDGDTGDDTHRLHGSLPQWMLKVYNKLNQMKYYK